MHRFPVRVATDGIEKELLLCFVLHPIVTAIISDQPRVVLPPESRSAHRGYDGLEPPIGRRAHGHDSTSGMTAKAKFLRVDFGLTLEKSQGPAHANHSEIHGLISRTEDIVYGIRSRSETTLPLTNVGFSNRRVEGTIVRIGDSLEAFVPRLGAIVGTECGIAVHGPVLGSAYRCLLSASVTNDESRKVALMLAFGNSVEPCEL